MKHDEWMNQAVRQEIEDLQQTRGFEEDEAVAYWHLRQAERLIHKLRRVNFEERLRQENWDTIPSEEAAALVGIEAAALQADVLQHFTALYRELDAQVLRRNYPERRGGSAAAADEDEED